MELREEFLSRALQLRGELIAQELQLRNEFFSHVSHELRSPLTAIYQFTTILLDGLAGDINTAQREYLGIALRNVQQLQAMIDDLLTATRARAGGVGVRPDGVDLSVAIQEVIDALGEVAGAKEISPTWEAAADLPLAYADPSLVRQVLIHLVHNAIKFNRTGGRVHVEARTSPEAPDLLLVRVCDSGVGIDPERAARLFDRLPQPNPDAASSRSGLGLGLYIVRELVARQGGIVTLESQPDLGSTFSFTLPAFSLARVIAPVVEHARRRTDSLTLVVVEVSRRATEPASQTPAERLASVRRELQPCLVPGFEVLLPDALGHGGDRRLFVVASVEENAGQSAVDRMRDHLARAEPLRHRGLAFAVAGFPLEPLSPGADSPPEQRPAAVAARVESLLSQDLPVGRRLPSADGADTA